MDQRPIRARLAPDAQYPPRRQLRITRWGVAGVVALIAVTAVVAQSCQQAQVRVTKERAIATALPRAGFTPQRTQIRLVRQGLTSRPYWAISFSISSRSGETYDRLTTVRVDANTGKIDSINHER